MKKSLWIVGLLLIGCAAQTPRATVSTQQEEMVPGHPDLHYGPEHMQCNAQGDCELVRSWLTSDNKPVLTPLGCFLAKTRLTWLLGDRVSYCEKKEVVLPAEVKPHWAERSGDQQTQGVCTWCTQRGEWRCPDNSYKLVRRDNGQMPGLSMVWDDRAEQQLVCRR